MNVAINKNHIGYVLYPAFCASGTEFRGYEKMSGSTMVE